VVKWNMHAGRRDTPCSIGTGSWVKQQIENPAHGGCMPEMVWWDQAKAPYGAGYECNSTGT